VDQVTRTPDAPDAGAAPGGTRGRTAGPRQALDYALLAPPSYDNIVGGAPPSPIASVLLVIGGILVVVAIVQTALGASDTSQWWVTGAILAAVGLFLAAFVSRRG
jgi:cytochrome c oxidase assembly factor CtaG